MRGASENRRRPSVHHVVGRYTETQRRSVSRMLIHRSWRRTEKQSTSSSCIKARKHGFKAEVQTFANVPLISAEETAISFMEALRCRMCAGHRSGQRKDPFRQSHSHDAHYSPTPTQPHAHSAPRPLQPDAPCSSPRRVTHCQGPCTWCRHCFLVPSLFFKREGARQQDSDCS